MVQLNTPLYLDIYNQLLKDIKTGVYNGGIKLPSEKDVAAQYQVSRITSKKAFEMLADQNIIKRIPGKGSYINESSVAEEPEEISDPNLAEKKGKLIGLIIEEIGESFGVNTVSGVEKGSAEFGYNLLLKCSYGDQKKEEFAIRELIEAGAEGLIIMPVHGDNFNPAILKLSIESFPVVLIDRELKGVPASFVGTDNYTAAYALTDFLFELGHEKICFVSPMDTGTSTVMERRRGFVESNMKHGVLLESKSFINEIKSTLPYNNTSDSLPGDIKLVMEYIKENRDITSFFTVEYNIALIVYRAIRNLELQVPEEYSIVCFDSPVNFVNDYRFTFVRQNEELVGRKSVKILLDTMNGSKEIKKVYIDSEIIKGKSTNKIEK